MPELLPPKLAADIEQAGYYPALVADVVLNALGGEAVVEHLVHVQTTFDHDEFHRHITVLALTERKLVIAHADDHPDDPRRPAPRVRSAVTATSETVSVKFVRGVTLTHVVAEPERYVPGQLGREVTLTLGWGTMTRVDLLPATCGDPNCEAEHGFEGSLTGDDISLRISAEAEGEGQLQQALAFARALAERVGTSEAPLQ